MCPGVEPLLCRGRPLKSTDLEKRGGNLMLAGGLGPPRLSRNLLLSPMHRSPFSPRALRCPAILLSMLLTAAGTTACGGRQDGAGQTYTEAAEEAYARAERALSRRDFPLARERFRNVYQTYPYSRFAALSELGMADTFFEERSWARAVEAYRRFVRFHPTHERVSYASFRIAQAYYRQMPRDPFLMPPSHERSLGTALEAHQALQSFLAEHGQSEFGEEASELLASVRARLARHELYVAEFYMRRGNPTAVADRTGYLIERFPETEVVPQALFLSARALLELGEVPAARERLQRLVELAPDSELARRAAPYLH